MFKIRKSFEFIDGFKLTAIVDKYNESILEISYKNKFKDSMTCIHTVISEISIEDYNNLNEDDLETIYKNKNKKNIPLKLSMKENFFALCSWVQCIAESIYDFLKINSDFEISTSNNDTAIFSFILRFLLYYDENLWDKFLFFIEKNAKSQSFVDFYTNLFFQAMHNIPQNYLRRTLNILGELLILNPNPNILYDHPDIFKYAEIIKYPRIKEILE